MDDKPAAPRKILLITNIDHGEANVFLATAHELLQSDPRVQIHFATFGGLEAAVDATWEHARLTAPDAEQIAYHKIEGLPMADGIRQYFASNDIPIREGYLPESFLASPSFSNTRRAIKDVLPIFVPYDGPQLVTIFSSIVDIIGKVEADLVVVDSLMTPALTACWHLGIKFACLSPNAIKEFAASSQPWAGGLWKYPALFSGFAYPVPWHQIPLNIFFVLYTAKVFIQDAHRRNVGKHLTAQTGATLRTPVDLLKNRPSDLKILVSTLPELDFPSVRPQHVFPCGPIVRSAPAISQTDPELKSWLSRRPTVYINMGSICLVDEEQASELALALKTVLDSSAGRPGSPGLQVLWKLKKYGDYKVLDEGSKIHNILSEEIGADLVRILDWIVPEPSAVLETGQVVCSIHHGGANSFNEAIIAGVPQIVLPQWTDCYDYAQRVEMLGVGRLGNRAAKPSWSAQELGGELANVLFGADSDAMKLKARELAQTCQEKGSGAMNAAQILLAECVKN